MLGVCVSRFTLDIRVSESCALTCRSWALCWGYVSAAEYGGASDLAAATGTDAAAQVVVERFARGGYRDGGPGGGNRRCDTDTEHTVSVGGRLGDSVAYGERRRHHGGESRFMFSDRTVDDGKRRNHQRVGEVGAHRLA